MSEQKAGQSQERDIARRGVSAAKWGASSTLVRFVLQIGAQVVLARILGPAAYGVFGVGVLIIALTTLLTELGFGWNLLKMRELQPGDIDFAFTWQMIFGVCGALVMYFCGDLIASVLSNDAVGWVISSLSIALVLNAAAGTPSILLQRELNFRELGRIQIVSYAIGYFAVGIPLAYAGFGAKALIAAWLTQSALRCLLALRAYPRRWKPTFRHPAQHSFMANGLLVFLTNVVNWLAYNLDRVIVSKWMSAHALGVYTVSGNLASTPNSIILSSLQPVFMATGARLGGVDALRDAYRSVLRSALLLGGPFFAGLAVCSPAIVALLYGSKWTDAAPVLRILMASMPLFVIWSLSTPILWNTGRAYLEAAAQVPVVVIAAGLYLLARPGGPVGIALMAATVLALRAGVLVAIASARLRLRLLDLLPEFVLALALSAIVVVCDLGLQQLHLPAIVELLLMALLAPLGCGLLIMSLPARLSARTVAVFGSVWRPLGRILGGKIRGAAPANPAGKSARPRDEGGVE